MPPQILALLPSEASGRVASTATGVGHVPERPERHAVGHRGDAAGGIRASRGRSVDRESCAEEGGQSFSSRRVLRRERVGADGACRGSRRIAAGGRRNRVPLLSVVRARSQPGSDPPGSAFPGVSRRHADTVSLSAEGVVRREVTSRNVNYSVRSAATGAHRSRDRHLEESL
jgi:hypothetical protein